MIGSGKPVFPVVALVAVLGTAAGSGAEPRASCPLAAGKSADAVAPLAAVVHSAHELASGPFRDCLRESLAAAEHTDLSYDAARDEVFDLWQDDDDYVREIYEGRRATRMGKPRHTDVNVEHIWPRSYFAANEYAGPMPGKEKRKDKNKSPMVSDLHHLAPSDTNWNSRRGNRPYGVVEDCPSDESCYADGIVDPPDAFQGDIARALFYMAVRYDKHLDDELEETLRQWHASDPPDADERARNDGIEEIQGTRNPFVDGPELVGDIEDF